MLWILNTDVLTFEGFLRSLSIHLQICWQVVTGKKFFWSSLIAGWGLPGLFLAITLPITGVSYRFGDTCHINHTKALQDYWGPLLAFAAISTILQFATFGYCIKVYIQSLFNDGSANFTVQVGSGLPTHSSHSGSVKTITAGQAYRRVKKVIGLQWRGTAIVLIIIVNVVFLSIVFVQMDNTVTEALHDLARAEPWLLCLVINGGDKTPCLDTVKRADLVANEGTVMAALVLLSVGGTFFSRKTDEEIRLTFPPSSTASGPCSSSAEPLCSWAGSTSSDVPSHGGTTSSPSTPAATPPARKITK